jgi:sulfite exporter TauE/SafE
MMGKVIQQQGLKAQFSLGICNGLIPCGLVYLAVIGAANTGSPLMGAGFMVAFGLGTLPLLTATLVAGRRLNRGSAAALLARWTPVLMLAVGILLVWRGGSAHLPANFQNFQDLAFPPMCH